MWDNRNYTYIIISIHWNLILVEQSTWFRFIIISLANRLSVQSSHDKLCVFRHRGRWKKRWRICKGRTPSFILTVCNRIWGCILSIYKQYKKLPFIFSLIDDNFVFLRLPRFPSFRPQNKSFPLTSFWQSFNQHSIFITFFPLCLRNLIDLELNLQKKSKTRRMKRNSRINDWKYI